MVFPVAGTSLTQAGNAIQRKAEAAPDLVERFAAAMETATAPDPDVMRQFEKKFEEQLLNQMMRDSQKLTRKLTGKE